MTDLLQLTLLILTLGLTAGAAFVTFKGFGLIKIGWLNFSRLKDLEKQTQGTKDPLRKKALQKLIEHCQTLRGQWILKEPDLEIAEKTRHLAESIASIYHPQSDAPLMEARLGKLLEAFLELKTESWSSAS